MRERHTESEIKPCGMGTAGGAANGGGKGRVISLVAK
jgi:hypothetical protein